MLLNVSPAFTVYLIVPRGACVVVVVLGIVDTVVTDADGRVVRRSDASSPRSSCVSTRIATATISTSTPIAIAVDWLWDRPPLRRTFRRRRVTGACHSPLVGSSPRPDR